jgi:hypothetical protein
MQDFDAERMNRVFLEFERLAYRVERSSTHYQVLGVDNDASIEEVKHAYRAAVSLIQPIYSGRYKSIEADLHAKAARILRKTSNAFSVLCNFGKRIEYDNLLFKKRPRLMPIPPLGSAAPDRPMFSNPVTEPASSTILLQGAAPQSQAAVRAAGRSHYDPTPALASGVPQLQADSSESERRRYERFDLSVPVTIIGHDRLAGQWGESALTLDVSRLGARLRANLSLRHGNVVQLKLAMPANLRSHGFTEPLYSVYAITRRIGPPDGGPRTIGFEFLGPTPPAGYPERPWASYRSHTWNSVERRREKRVERTEVVTLKYLDELHTPVRQEIALTENISLGGAMIYVKGAPPETELIRIANLTHSFESLSRICDRYIGDDGLEHISLQFIDRKWTLE